MGEQPIPREGPMERRFIAVKRVNVEVMAAADLLMYSTNAVAKFHAFPTAYADCRIVQSKLWPDAGVIGAAILARDRQ